MIINDDVDYRWCCCSRSWRDRRNGWKRRCIRFPGCWPPMDRTRNANAERPECPALPVPRNGSPCWNLPGCQFRSIDFIIHLIYYHHHYNHQFYYLFISLLFIYMIVITISLNCFYSNGILWITWIINLYHYY